MKINGGKSSNLKFCTKPLGLFSGENNQNMNNVHTLGYTSLYSNSSLGNLTLVQDRGQNISSRSHRYFPSKIFKFLNFSRGNNFDVNLIKLKAGIDLRTTFMIRNIPNAYTQRELVSRLDFIIKGMYDFVYLPIDFVVRIIILPLQIV